MAEAAEWGAATPQIARPRLDQTVHPVRPANQGVTTAATADATPGATSGATSGAVRALLRAEGLALLIGTLVLYAQSGVGWGFFAAALLLPDLALLAYLVGPRAGAIAYNATHSTLGPLASTALGAFTASPLLMATGLVWGAHVGVDRALGFGLKYARGFSTTHLGHVGRPDPW